MATATVDKVYVSNGAGSGAWQKIETDQLDAAIKSINKGVITAFISDIASGTAELNRAYLIMPYACTVAKVYSVINRSLATADATLTCANNAGSSMGTIVVAFSGSAAGDIDSLTPVSNNTFAAGERMLISSDGGGSNTVPATIIVEFTYT